MHSCMCLQAIYYIANAVDPTTNKLPLLSYENNKVLVFSVTTI